MTAVQRPIDTIVPIYTNLTHKERLMIGTGVKRGSAELAILSIIDEGPLHGYELDRRIERQTRGALSFSLAAFRRANSACLHSVVVYAALHRRFGSLNLKPCRRPRSSRIVNHHFSNSPLCGLFHNWPADRNYS